MEIILTPIVEIILKPIAESVARPIGVLSRYKQNLRNLEDEVKNLENQISNVQGRVNEAKDSGEDIENDVTVWLKDADEAIQGVAKFRADKSRKENMLCFNFQCPNLISRYRLSKEAQKKVDDVKCLTGCKIDRVSHPQEAPLEVTFARGYESFDSRQRVFEDIVKALKDPKVNMIGVYGTGGVGKTTMVTKVAKQLKKDGTFDAVALAVVSQDAIVKEIQGQLADCLNLTLSGETEVGRAKDLWHHLDNVGKEPVSKKIGTSSNLDKQKKYLIIFDDVWEELDLRKIGIPIKDGSKSCKVLLTSRNRDVWKNMSVEHEFEIKFLSAEESWLLFRKKVENCGDANEILARAVCKECQGLPVAIIALGAALKDKDINVWKDALDKLRNSMLKDIVGIPKVYTSLKWSYDRLDSEDAKSCFLLCCLFPEQSWIHIEELARYYIGGRSFHRDQKPDSSENALYRIHAVLSTLQRRCLLLDNISDGNIVKMHDIVRDVAISIAKVDKSFLVKHGVVDWPDKASYENSSVISLRPKGMRRIPDELCCPKLDTLRLDCRANEFQLEVPDRFFNGMENLTVLHFYNVKMSPNLPTSIAKLAKLQMLCLDGCELEEITTLKYLRKHLEILSLKDSSIKELPPEVGELSLLRQLDMEGCENLEVVPKGIISKLCCLENLYMPSTFGNWEGATSGSGWDISIVSLDELMALTRLTTLHIFIPDAALLPKDFSFEDLVTFRIAVGEIDDSDHDYSTGALMLANIHLVIALGGLLCIQRTGLYPSKSINRLTRLCINNCSVKYLISPSSAIGLVQLKELTIKRCKDMEGVIGNEGEVDEDMVVSFKRLKKLRLENLPKFISFYLEREKTTTSSESSSARAQTAVFTDKVSFPALEELYISGVPNISNIWDKKLGPVESFSWLFLLDVTFCDKLVNVFESTMLPRLRNLLNLSLKHCPMVEAIVNSEKTEKETQETASNTMEGVIGNEGEEDEDMLISFRRLSELRLEYLPSLISFYLEKEKTTTSGESSSPRSQTAIFTYKVSFPLLDKLYISGVPNISNIWDKKLGPVESFSWLSSLDVTLCDKLVNVFESTMLPRLQNLDNLSLKHCPMVEAIVNSEKIEKETQETASNTMEGVIGNEGEDDEDMVISFGDLSELRLEYLPSLISFYLEKEKTTTSGETSSARAHTAIFTDKVSFPALEQLYISGVPNISNIWDKKLGPVESFSQLFLLDVAFCDKLVNVFESTMLPRLRNLYAFSVGRCPMVEAIFNLEKAEEKTQETAINTMVPILPDLENIILQDLQNIKGLCTLRIEEQPVFHAQIVFPKLERLLLMKLGEMALRQLLGAFELNSQMRLCFCGCDEISSVVSPHLFRTLSTVGLLSVDYCSRVTEVFHFDGLEVGEGQECVGPSAQVRMINLDDLPQLTCLWNKDPRSLLDLRNLEYLTITDCPLLQNLMTASVAKALGGLKVLYLKSCSTMEEVIATEEGHEGVIDDDEIIFPKLEWLILKDLSNLKSFCNGSYNFHLPSLKKVVLKMCPNMQSFTSGSVRMPPTFFISRGNDGIVIEDVNKHLQQQHLKGEEIIEVDSDEMCDEGDKFSDLFERFWSEWTVLK